MVEKLNKEDHLIIENLTKRIKSLKEESAEKIIQAETFQKAVDLLLSVQSERKHDLIASNGHTIFIGETKHHKSKPGPKTGSKDTFVSIVTEIFNRNQKPLTTKEVVVELKKVTGNDYPPRNVSSQLINGSKKPGTIKKQHLPERKFHEANVWGLTTWFHGDKMDNRYLDKVKAPELSEY